MGNQWRAARSVELQTIDRHEIGVGKWRSGIAAECGDAPKHPTMLIEVRSRESPLRASTGRLRSGSSVPLWPNVGAAVIERRSRRPLLHLSLGVVPAKRHRSMRIPRRGVYATHLLQGGAPITYVSQQLGHADASITLRVYAHYLPDSALREVDRLDESVPAHPNASQAHPETATTDDVIAAKSFFAGNTQCQRRRVAQSTSCSCLDLPLVSTLPSVLSSVVGVAN